MNGNMMAVDPGRDKCGFAVVDGKGRVLYRQVICTDDLTVTLRTAMQEFLPAKLVIGNGTTSRAAQACIKAALPDLALEVVDEYRTTELAKKAYWRLNPPQGLRRFLPVTLQVPPVPVDDLVAVILARRKLGYHEY
jgi:RNase H-fold protein (predicted Holliday junction resolvase)